MSAQDDAGCGRALGAPIPPPRAQGEFDLLLLGLPKGSSPHKLSQGSDTSQMPLRRLPASPARAPVEVAAAFRGNAVGEPSRQLVDLARDQPRRCDRRPRRREPFEAMPQASRVASGSTWPGISPGDAIGAHAVASPSRQCRRRAASPAGRPSRRSARAMRSVSTPSRALRGNAAGEPSHQLVDRACDPARRCDRRPRRREPFEAMPQASRVASGSTWPGISPGDAIGAHAIASPSRRCRRRAESPAGRPGPGSAQAMRSAPTPSRALRADAACEPSRQLVGPAGDHPRRCDRRPRRREPFGAMPKASRVAGWSTWPGTNPGDAIGAHAVASPSRRCRRRAESPAARPGRRSAQAMRSAPTPSRALRGNAAGEPNRQLVDAGSGQPRRCVRRPRRRKPFEAMPQASRVAIWSTWQAISPGDAVGAHAVASPSRRCRR